MVASMEVRQNSFSVLHFEPLTWRSFEVDLADGHFRQVGDTGPQSHDLHTILSPLLHRNEVTEWWRCCFFVQGRKISWDDYYLNFPIGEGESMRFAEWLSVLQAKLPIFPLSRNRPLLISGCYRQALPLHYLIQQQYASDCWIGKGTPQHSPRFYPFYIGLDQQPTWLPCYGETQRQMVYKPYLPGQPMHRSWLWIERDQVDNPFICTINDQQQATLTPWIIN